MACGGIAAAEGADAERRRIDDLSAGALAGRQAAQRGQRAATSSWVGDGASLRARTGRLSAVALLSSW